MWYTTLAMDHEPTVIRRLRPTSPLPFIAWGLLLFVQWISPAHAWSWLLVGLTLLLAINFYWAWRLYRDV
ncbi:MAG: hypothetical protein N2439_01060, partial [Anaerolineae bacterium]|nr:hypothetical protein [Anaerolineae bacterium]